jgi:hypothetical protein
MMRLCLKAFCTRPSASRSLLARTRKIIPCDALTLPLSTGNANARASARNKQWPQQIREFCLALALLVPLDSLAHFAYSVLVATWALRPTNLSPIQFYSTTSLLDHATLGDKLRHRLQKWTLFYGSTTLIVRPARWIERPSVSSSQIERQVST